jgi:hypothetical protein
LKARTGWAGWDKIGYCIRSMSVRPVTDSGPVTDDELLRAVRDTFLTLDRWREALAAIIEPVPGSDLAEDDKQWPYMRASTLVQCGLATAREHLHAVRLSIEAGELFPAAVSTLCRSALIGASLAVWVLEPDDRSLRLRRSLSLALEDYDRHLQYGIDVKSLLPPERIRPGADEQLDRLQLRRSQVLALLDEVGGVAAVNLTNDVLPTAVKVAVPDEGDQLRADLVLRWRAMSGAAHALLWHYFGYEGTSASEVDEGGVGTIEVAGDIPRLAMDYFTGYRVAVAGWRLLEVRSRVGNAPSYSERRPQA